MIARGVARCIARGGPRADPGRVAQMMSPDATNGDIMDWTGHERY